MSKEARDLFHTIYKDLIHERDRMVDEYNEKIAKARKYYVEEENKILAKLKINDKEFVKLIEDYGFIMKPTEFVCDISDETHVSYQNFELPHPKMWLFYQGYKMNGEYIINNVRISWPYSKSEVFINPSDMTNEELIKKFNQLKNSAFRDKN